jgi:hypothetical protein
MPQWASRKALQIFRSGAQIAVSSVQRRLDRSPLCTAISPSYILRFEIRRLCGVGVCAGDLAALYVCGGGIKRRYWKP